MAVLLNALYRTAQDRFGKVRNSATAITAITIANFTSFMIAFPFDDSIAVACEPQNSIPTTRNARASPMRKN